MGRKKTKYNEVGNPIHYVEGCGYYVKTSIQVDDQRHSITKRWFPTSESAKKWLIQEKKRLVDESVSSSFRNWEELEADFLDALESKSAPSTVYAAKCKLKVYLEPYFSGKTAIEAYEPKNVKRFIENLRKAEMGAQSKNKVVSFYRGILKYAYKTMEIGEKAYQRADVMVEDFKDARKAKKNRDVFSKEDEEAFLSAWKEGSEEWLMWRLLFSVGMRESEFLALTPSSFDFSEPSVTVDKQVEYVDGRYRITTRLKTDSSYRTIYIPEQIANDVRRFVDDFGIGEDERIFKYSKTSFNRLFKKTVEMAGIEGKELTCHSVRHTLVLKYARSCTNAEELENAAMMMGHSVEMERKTYMAHATPEIGKKLAEAI